VKLLKFDLQLFSEEKTEKATPKKRREAREKGQVVFSKDLGSSFSLLMVFLFLNFYKSIIIKMVADFLYLISDKIGTNIDSIFEFKSLNYLMNETILLGAKIILPIVVVAMITGVLFAYFQIGFLFTTETIKFKLDKISPVKGFKRMFSIRALVEFLKSILKSAILLYISLSYLLKKINMFYESVNYSVAAIADFMWDVVFNIVVRCSLLLFILAIFDYAYKKWQDEKDLKMSRKEIKDEYKQSEGDPMLKSKIREKQRQLATGRMMQDVPNADVIITNPTHYAVGIKYDPNRGDAPYVLAKGRDLVAKNIKKVAEENDVPIVENKPLAQALYKEIDIGDFIPPNLYEAVAEVLAYVYKLKK